MADAEGIISVDINQIGPDGFILEEQFPARSLDLDTPDAVFSSPLSVNCTFNRDGDNVLITGTASGRVRLRCGRCLKTCEIEITAEIDEFRSAENDPQIDISLGVRESIVLSYPAIPLCSDECKGLCQVCGQDLNRSDCGCKKQSFTSMGEKLKDLSKKLKTKDI